MLWHSGATGTGFLIGYPRGMPDFVIKEKKKKTCRGITESIFFRFKFQNFAVSLVMSVLGLDEMMIEIQ